MLPTRSYTVDGMTCGHCSKTVIEHVLQVAGVKGADVDLDSRQLKVAGESFEDDAVRTAVVEAGYSPVS